MQQTCYNIGMLLIIYKLFPGFGTVRYIEHSFKENYEFNYKIVYKGLDSFTCPPLLSSQTSSASIRHNLHCNSVAQQRVKHFDARPQPFVQPVLDKALIKLRSSANMLTTSILLQVYLVFPLKYNFQKSQRLIQFIVLERTRYLCRGSCHQ